MGKEDLVRMCRYYRGQDKNPFTDNDLAWFWDMERVWVNCDGNFIGETEYYLNIGGKKYKGIPFSMLMVLFTGWGKYTTDIKSNINNFYTLIDLYLDFVSDVMPKDRIPNL